MKKLFIVIPLLLLVLSCSFGTTTTASNPSIVAFTASPTSITAGESVTLVWNVTDATSIQIDQGVGSGLAVAGTVSVTPASTATYTLTASNSAGSASSAVTITVSSSSSTVTPPVVTPTAPLPALRPNIVVFDISPNIINVPPGVGPHSAVMRREVRNAGTVTINGSPVSAAGSQTLTPGLGTHTYVLRAFNPAGEDTKTQILHVNP
jgi:PKD repeat protein